MLESAGFDFRGKYPTQTIVKILKHCHIQKEPVYSTAYRLCLDLHRTYSPLKQTSFTMATACVEMAMRIHDLDLDPIRSITSTDHDDSYTSRAEVMGKSLCPLTMASAD